MDRQEFAPIALFSEQRLIVGGFPPSLFWLICFILVSYKERELRNIEQMLAKFTPLDIETLTKESLDRIEFLRRRSSETETLPEWPFASRSLMSVCASTVTALCPVLLKLVLASNIVKQYMPVLKS
jgi:hypothetical protein